MGLPKINCAALKLCLDFDFNRYTEAEKDVIKYLDIFHILFIVIDFIVSTNLDFHTIRRESYGKWNDSTKIESMVTIICR